MTDHEFEQFLAHRIQALETEVLQLKQELAQFAHLAQTLELVPHLEANVNRYQAYFSMISDIDTFLPIQALLEKGDFKAADQETAKILYGIINQTPNSVTPSDIENFPAAPLRIVDRLWRQYSQDRFGLKVQLQIYQELGGNLNSLIAQDEDLVLAFADRIGWRKGGAFIYHGEWKITDQSPIGFLPFSLWITPYGLKVTNFILARLIKIGL